MSRYRIVRITTLALFLSLLSPWGSLVQSTFYGANAANPPVVTITIALKSNIGAALEHGAQVFAVFPDGRGGIDSTTVTESGSTGNYILTLPQGSSDTQTDFTMIEIEPPISDTSNAIYTTGTLSRATSSSITVNLRKADLRVTLKNAVGEPSETFTSIELPTSTNADGSIFRLDEKQGLQPDGHYLSQVTTLRQGPFGVALPLTVNVESSSVNAAVVVGKISSSQDLADARNVYSLNPQPSENDTSYSEVPGFYFFMVFNDGSGGSVRLFSADDQLKEIHSTAGIYTLTTRNCGSSSHSIVCGGTKLDYQIKNPGGNENTELPANPAGTTATYDNVFLHGVDSATSQIDNNMPRAQGSLWIDGWGYAYVDTSQDRKILPVVMINGSDTLTSFIAAPIWSHNGGFSNAEGGETATTINFVRPSGGTSFAIHLRSETGTAVSNTILRVFKGTRDDIQRYYLGDNYLSGDISNAAFNFPTGTGKYMIEIIPDSGDLGNNIITIDTANAIPTITDQFGRSESTSIVAGVNLLNFVVMSNNVKLFITQPNTDIADTLGSNNWVGYSRNSNGCCQFGGNQPTEDGEWKFAVPSGTYYFTIFPSKESSLLSSREFKVIVSETGTVSVIDDTENAVAPRNGGKFYLHFAGSNFFFKIVNPNNKSEIVSGSHAEYFEVDSQGRQQGNGSGTRPITDSPLGSKLGASKTYGFRVVGPNGSNYASKQFIVVVNSSNVVTSVTSGDESVTADTNGTYSLELAGANIFGTIKDSAGGGSLQFDPNQGHGASVSLQKYVADPNGGHHWDYVSGGLWSDTGNFALRVEDPGTYRIQVDPNGLGDYTTSFSSSIVVSNPESITVLSTMGETSTSIVVKLSAPNFKMQLMNPATSTPLTSGYVQIDSISGKNRNWYAGVGIDPRLNGHASTRLEVGTYVATVYPWGDQGTFIAGLATKSYSVVVTGDSAQNIAVTSFPDTSTVLTSETGTYVLAAGSANLTGRIINASNVPVGSTNAISINVSLFKLRSDKQNWDWISGVRAAEDGTFSTVVEAIGTYRLRIEPYGTSDYSSSYSSQFDITNIDAVTARGDLVIASPTLRVRVTAGGSPVSYAGVEIRKNDQFIDWTNAGLDGVVSLNLTQTGQYQLVLNPDQSHETFTRKTYTVNVTAGDTTTVSYNGTPVSGTLELALGSATISGHLYAPGGSTEGIANTDVVAVDQATGQEMWQFSANTSNATSTLGAWAMSLPKGTYKIYGRAPWGNSNYADTALSASFTVSDSGDVSPSIDTALHLQTPLWKGTVFAPDSSTVGVANVSVCLGAVISGVQSWKCTVTDNAGNWALNPPSGFTGTFETNSRLEVRENQEPQYSSLILTTPEALNPILGGLSPRTAVALHLLNPNTTITITAPGGESTANLWVNLDAPNVGWLGGASTNAAGVAKFNLANPAQGFNVRVDLNGKSELSSIYASTTQVVSAAPGRTTVVATLQLLSPNLRGVVRDPATQSVLANTWVDLYDVTNNQGLGGANSDQNGFFALNAPTPVSGTTTYQLSVNPPWNGSSNSTRNVYKLIVPATGTPTLTLNEVAVETETVGNGPAFKLQLATPSVSGVVKMPDGSLVANSWITPTLTSTGETQWQNSSNSRADGYFGLSVADGSYKIEANVPWNVTGVAKSAACSVTVSGGRVTTTVGGCVQNGQTLQLDLRSPNLSFTIHDALDQVLPFTHVGIQIGNWRSDAQSDATGKVSFFLSPSDFSAQSTGFTAKELKSIHVTVDPPYGNSDVVRLDCDSLGAGTQCSDLPMVEIDTTTAIANINKVIKLNAPNMRFRVEKPDGNAVGIGAWVTLLAVPKDNPNTRIWIGGSTTNADGFASFNVDTSTVFDSFTVEVNPPGEFRQTYSSKQYGNNRDGLTFAFVNGNTTTFALATPNLVLTIQDANSVKSKWGWVGVEQDNGGGNFNWVGGYGIDEKGTVSLALASSQHLRITANPAPGSSGVRTACLVTTSVAGEVSLDAGPGCSAINGGLETITLNAGNVIGKIMNKDGSGIADATIYATTGGKIVTSTSKADGSYGMDLDPALTWDIKVFPANPDSDPVQYNAHSEAGYHPSGTIKNITLTPVV